jgi:type IV fimbrial biogenesis protein FimT
LKNPATKAIPMQSNGLTLLELLVTLTLVAVLAMAGIPALLGLIQNQRMTAQINGLVHGVHLARLLAQTRLADAVICGSSTGRRCDPGMNWTEGWLLFMNLDRDFPAQVDAREPVLATGDVFRNGTIRANRRAFVFRPFEIRSTNGTLVFCDARGAGQARALVISYTGRPRIATHRPDGKPLQCPSE